MSWLPANTAVGHWPPPPCHVPACARVGEMSDADKQMVRGTLWTTVMVFGGGLALLYLGLKGARL